MGRTRSFVLAAAVVGVLIIPCGASAAGGVTGTYATTITKSNHLNGRWVLVLGTGGTYTVAQNGFTLARGKYSETGTAITFDREQGSGCRGPGTYAWRTYTWPKSGKTITFALKREDASCGARAEILGHWFTQAG